MTVKDFTTLAADITVALPDNTAGDIEAVNTRQSILDLLDSMALGAAGPITYATAQPTFAPQAATIGKWRTVSDADFSDGFSMTSQDYVRFVNCRFGGVTSLTTCDHVQFAGCSCDGVTGNGLTLTTCNFLKFNSLELGAITLGGLRLIGCNSVFLDNLLIDGVTTGAAAMATGTTRKRMFESIGNHSEPASVTAAVLIENSSRVKFTGGVRIRNCQRTGIYVHDSADVTINEIDTVGISDYSATTATLLSDAPVVLQDSTNVIVNGGEILDSGFYGIFIFETVPAAVAGGLGLLQNNILIEKLKIQHGPLIPVDDQSDMKTSSGIEIHGGSEITVQNCEIAYCGETGIHQAYGSDRERVYNCNIHHCGQNAGRVHHDGIGTLAGYGADFSGNTIRDNYRNGISVKPGFADVEGSFNNEYPVADYLIRHNAIVNNGRAGDGYGVYVYSTTPDFNRSASDRMTVSENIIRENDFGNVHVALQAAHIQFVNNHIGPSIAGRNCRVHSGAHDIAFVGGFIHSGGSGEGGFYSINVEDFGGPAPDTVDIRGVNFGVDLAYRNRKNLDLAIAAATDPLDDGLKASLDAATGIAGFDIRFYKWLLDEGTPGSGQSADDTMRRPDHATEGLRDADRMRNALRIRDLGSASFLAASGELIESNRSYLFTEGANPVAPYQELSLENDALEGGPVVGQGSGVFAANGRGPVFSYGNGTDLETAQLDDVQAMLKRGWTSVNTFPTTGLNPSVVSIVDAAAVEAVPALVARP